MSRLANWYRYSFKYEVNKRRDNFRFWLAGKLPRWVIYHAVIRAAVTDEMGNPGDVTAVTMLKRFESRG